MVEEYVVEEIVVEMEVRILIQCELQMHVPRNKDTSRTTLHLIFISGTNYQLPRQKSAVTLAMRARTLDDSRAALKARQPAHQRQRYAVRSLERVWTKIWKQKRPVV